MGHREKKGKDNGLLVLICPPERKMRVEVGYGLEGVITDGLAGSVIRNSFTPAFKQGEYGKGTVEGVTQLARFVTGADSGQAFESAHPNPVPLDLSAGKIFHTLFFSVFVVFGLLMVGLGISDKVVFIIFWGLCFGGIPLGMIISEDGTESWNVWTLGVLGLLALVTGLWLGFRYPKALKIARKRKKQRLDMGRHFRRVRQFIGRRGRWLRRRFFRWRRSQRELVSTSYWPDPSVSLIRKV